MSALLAYVLSILRESSHPRFVHHLHVPYPSVMHQVLDDNFISGFNEVFVIGDVHGCNSELVDLLQEADANGSDILKIFVGDLVNKGTENVQTLAHVRNMKSALSVRGNHDEIVLKTIQESRATGSKFSAANEWMANLTKDAVDYLSNLPYTISIPSLQAMVVHAGIIPGVPLDRIHPYHLVHMRNLVIGDYFWEGGLQAASSDAKGHPWASLWPGPTHVYFGHDAKRALQQYPHATGLDTGCVYGKMLSGIFIMGPRKGNIVQVRARKVYREPGVKE